jgi:hypothetical protein
VLDIGYRVAGGCGCSSRISGIYVLKYVLFQVRLWVVPPPPPIPVLREGLCRASPLGAEISEMHYVRTTHYALLATGWARRAAGCLALLYYQERRTPVAPPLVFPGAAPSPAGHTWATAPYANRESLPAASLLLAINLGEDSRFFNPLCCPPQ